MRFAPKLYQIARTVNTIEALTSGDPKRMKRRLRNIVVGRLAARTGLLNKLFK